MIIWTLFWILGTNRLSVIPNVMKIMVPVSQQDCVFVRKDGLEKTALKVGMYSQCIVVSTQILSV